MLRDVRFEAKKKGLDHRSKIRQQVLFRGIKRNEFKYRNSRPNQW